MKGYIMRLEKFEIMKRIKHVADSTNDGDVNTDLENLLKILKDTTKRLINRVLFFRVLAIYIISKL